MERNTSACRYCFKILKNNKEKRPTRCNSFFFLCFYIYRRDNSKNKLYMKKVLLCFLAKRKSKVNEKAFFPPFVMRTTHSAIVSDFSFIKYLLFLFFHSLNHSVDFPTYA